MQDCIAYIFADVRAHGHFRLFMSFTVRAWSPGQTAVLQTRAKLQNQNLYRRVAKRYSQLKPSYQNQNLWLMAGWPNDTPNSSQAQNQNLHRRVAKRYRQVGVDRVAI